MPTPLTRRGLAAVSRPLVDVEESYRPTVAAQPQTFARRTVANGKRLSLRLPCRRSHKHPRLNLACHHSNKKRPADEASS